MAIALRSDGGERGEEAMSAELGGDLGELSALAGELLPAFAKRKTRFVASVEAMLEAAIEIGTRAHKAGEGPSGFAHPLEIVTPQPKAARLCLGEAYVAGYAAEDPPRRPVTRIEAVFANIGRRSGASQPVRRFDRLAIADQADMRAARRVKTGTLVVEESGRGGWQ